MHAAGGMVNVGDTITADVWTYDFDGRRTARSTFAGFNGSIVWTPDGERMLYAGFDSIGQVAGRIQSVPADNSAAPTTIAVFSTTDAHPSSISPDAGILLGTAAGTGGDIWALDLNKALAGDEPATESDFAFIVQSDFANSHATFSPDGRWIAYESDESGTNQIYVIPYPGPGGKYQISTDGGRQPRWNPAGGEIFYLNGTRMLAVDVQTEPRFVAGNPQVLFDNPLVNTGPTNGQGFQYAVAPDGQEFLMLSTGGGTSPQQLRVVENWFEELTRQVPR
jgi:Tol biopolymer transport system component